jgi:predicted O-methyltransferase YrrM
MNEILNDIVRTGRVRSVTGEQIDNVTGVTPDEGELLARLVREQKPRVSLEVGLAFGTSALYLCDALAEVGAKRHYIVDPNQSTEWKGIGIENLRRAGHGDLVELREKPSLEALPELLAAGVRLDFVFHDGWHVFDQTLCDFMFIDKMLEVGGILAFDDTTWPSMRKLLRYIVTNRAYSVVECLGSPHSRRDDVARMLRPLTSHWSRLLKPELVDPDGVLKLRPGSRCVVLRKDGEDHREITHHREF